MSETRPEERSPDRQAGAREAFVLAVLLGTIGAVLFRPWERLPFPVHDFGGLLTMLRSTSSGIEAYKVLLIELASEGRVTPLSMAYVTANWALFGTDPLGWQLVRACVMVAVAVAGYLLARALRVRRGAAVIAACLFIVADSARALWQMPQAFEHVAALFTILAALFAVGYQESVRWKARAGIIAAFIVLSIWVREPMIAAVPFILALALMYRGEQPPQRPKLDSRSLLLIGVTAAGVVVLTLVPLFIVRTLFEQPGGYATRFGLGNVTLANGVNVISALVLIVTREAWFPANAIAGIAIGVAALGRGAGASRYRSLIAVAAVLPLSAAVIYVMWPSFPSNYAFPYLVGIALAFGLALTRLWERSLVGRVLAVTASCVVLAYGMLLAMNERQQYAAVRRLDADMAQAVSEGFGNTWLLAAVDDPMHSGHYANGLRLYTLATTGAAPDSAKDVSCDEALRVVHDKTPDVLVIRPTHECASSPLAETATVLRQEARGRDWKTLRPERSHVLAQAWSMTRQSAAAAR